MGFNLIKSILKLSSAFLFFFFCTSSFAQDADHERPTPEQQIIEDALVNYTFKLKHPTNGWHEGKFSLLANGNLYWENKAGVGWSVKPVYANNYLDTKVDDCPYVDTPGGDKFQLIMEGETLKGFKFMVDEFYAYSVIEEVLLSNSFSRKNPENGYHTGTFTKVENGDIQWTNEAGVSWRMRPYYAARWMDCRIGTCPYLNEPGGTGFDFIMDGENIKGFKFMNEDYMLNTSK